MGITDLHGCGNGFAMTVVERKTINTTMSIARNILHQVRKQKPARIDYSKFKIEKGVDLPPRGISLTERSMFLQSLEPGDSFLIETKKAGGFVTAINKLFGKNAGAKRQVDLDFSRVYRVH